MNDMPQYLNLIGGVLKPAGSGGYLDSFNPATGELIGRVPASDRDDANEAVEAAAAAFPAWATTPPALRASYLDRVALIFEQHGDELARLESADNGNLIGVSEPMNGIAMVEVWKRAAHETVAASTGQSVVLDANTFGYTRREPYGVVAAIVPYNMPIAMFCVKASMALAAGNTVVAKPPEQASIGFLRLAELMVDSFPPGVVNVVSGYAEVGDAFVRHEKVDKVSMTGSAGRPSSSRRRRRPL